MEKRPPLVSIGMPLYNSERYLRQALDSLLAQDYPNFEVILSDNASSDATESICRAYAARDSRINYQRNEINVGAVGNFNRAFELARGEYFMWSAHDDLRAPQYLSSCVRALQARPDAVLCCSGVAFIDENGQPMEPWFVVTHPVGASVRARVGAIASARFWLDVYGLARTAALARTRLARPVWGFDVVVLMELCLRGPVLFVPEPMFYYRADRAKTQPSVALTLGAPAGQGSIPVDWSAMTLELVHAVRIAPSSLSRRAALMVELVIRLCVFNGLAGAGVRRDVRASMAQAWADRRVGRVAALLVLAALVFPAQNRLGRGGYRLVRRLQRARQEPE